ncbi:hypothetical protein HHK36_029022 [Tetracentron sinense]|uniref:Uncharacterized protein n=1 Tax=Tetracentron sinense TaxID=13715 RepID=A0A834YCI9_TETSI|nr:hypothetical protein HHK36_029022 [Tetracentron sinense]
MFDTAGLVDGISNAQSELCRKVEGVYSNSWHLNHQLQELPSLPSFADGMDSHYLPPFSMEVDGKRAMEMNEWVESQQCPNLPIWEHVEGLGREGIAPASSNMGALLSSYPSSL